MRRGEAEARDVLGFFGGGDGILAWRNTISVGVTLTVRWHEDALVAFTMFVLTAVKRVRYMRRDGYAMPTECGLRHQGMATSKSLAPERTLPNVS
jgi:hypothetical protein